ncbi:hypothetical protein C0989_006094 [Termitomyces sp. Mn162]|nr:hypothetical protein C0989_006094 [Termitomyces sp. Mn162]
MAGPSGPLSGMDAMQPPAGVVTSTRSKSGICLGVVQLVPEGSRVVQVEVTLEQFAEAAVCVTVEQGWDQGWVAAQLEEGRKGRVSGRGSGAGEGEWVSMPVMKVGPPWGGRREGAPSMQEKGKRRASSSPEAGPSKWAQGEQVEGLERLLVVREEEIQGVREERDGARRELDGVRRARDLAWKDKDIAVGTAVERLSHLQELEVRTVHLQVWAEAAEVATQQAGGSGVQETQQGSSVGEVQAAAERAQWWEEWLANEAASGQRGVLREWFPRFLLLSADSGSTDWAREHRILLDGASAALESIHDGLARMPGDLPLELGQGVTQMGCLLAGHWRRATADPGAWWEIATDVGKPLPGQPEVLAAVVAQLEVFMVGRVAGLGSEEEGE